MLDREDIFWQVTLGAHHIFVLARNRAGAVDQAKAWFGVDVDRATVTALNEPGDTIRIAMNLYI